MAMQKMRALGPGYTSEVDTVNEQRWCQILQEFDDANIYQTWSYAAVISGRRNMSHLILRKNDEITAVAQARIAKLPFISVGIAYIRWGPLWRRRATKVNVDTFRQAVRALRNEFVCKRGLVLRLFPLLFDEDDSGFAAMLAEEGFASRGEATRSRTILMDLSPPIDKLRAGMRPHWKRQLKVAERNQLEVIEGSQDELFEAFIDIYKEMVSRKNFVEPNDIRQYRLMQSQLPANLKMKILLCRSGEGVCAGLVCSIIGNNAVFLFGATSNAGIKSRGSYLLHWKLIEKLKKYHISIYDLNGINPIKNPGTYKFKNDLGGTNSKDVYFLGRFDAHTSVLSHWCVKCGEMLSMIHQSCRELTKAAHNLKPWTKTANS
jgi:lipid II:glycine glycyltransferase (peptidoglycan interpeptide bridge formation enzyme)